MTSCASAGRKTAMLVFNMLKYIDTAVHIFEHMNGKAAGFAVLLKESLPYTMNCKPTNHYDYKTVDDDVVCAVHPHVGCWSAMEKLPRIRTTASVHISRTSALHKWRRAIHQVAWAVQARFLKHKKGTKTLRILPITRFIVARVTSDPPSRTSLVKSFHQTDDPNFCGDKFFFFLSTFFRLTIKLGGIRSAEGWYEDQLGSLTPLPCRPLSPQIPSHQAECHSTFRVYSAPPRRKTRTGSQRAQKIAPSPSPGLVPAPPSSHGERLLADPSAKGALPASSRTSRILYSEWQYDCSVCHGHLKSYFPPRNTATTTTNAAVINKEQQQITE